MSWGSCEDCKYARLGTCEDWEVGDEASCFESYFEEDEDEDDEIDWYDDRLECGCCVCCGCSCNDIEDEI